MESHVILEEQNRELRGQVRRVFVRNDALRSPNGVVVALTIVSG